MSEPLHSDKTPEWVLAIFAALDAKDYGSAFNRLSDDAEAQLGMHRWQGRDAILAALSQAGATTESRHVVLDYREMAGLKIVRGEVTMTGVDGGRRN